MSNWYIYQLLMLLVHRDCYRIHGESFSPCSDAPTETLILFPKLWNLVYTLLGDVGRSYRRDNDEQRSQKPPVNWPTPVAPPLSFDFSMWPTVFHFSFRALHMHRPYKQCTHHDWADATATYSMLITLPSLFWSYGYQGAERCMYPPPSVYIR